MGFLKKYPLPIAGLILSLFAIGNLMAPYGPVVRNVIGMIGGILYVVYIAKLLVFHIKLKEQLDNPVVASVFPTITMATMIVPTYLKTYIPGIAPWIWYVGVGGHALLLLWFASKHLLHFSIKKVFPSWYIVFVGMAVASVTAPAVGQILMGKIAFWISFVGFIGIAPIVCYRVWKVGEIAEPARPTLIVLSAPASLLLAGYMSSFQEKVPVMVYFLLACSLLFYFIALFYLPGLLRLKFSPAYSAFTFPLVISAIAGKLTSVYFESQGMFKEFGYLAKFQEIVAILIVAWVLICYIRFLAQPQQTTQTQKA